jgi:hypothetical protein
MKATLATVVLLLINALSAMAQTPPPTPTPAPEAAPVAPAPPATPANTPGKEPGAPKKGSAPSPWQIKSGDMSVRFGILLQPQADFSENVATGDYAQNLQIRRTRLMMGGNVTKNVFFSFSTEAARLGGSNAAGTKNSSFQVLDAVAEWRLNKSFNLWGGLFYVPTTRAALKSSSSEFQIDQSAYAHTVTGALGGTSGRDAGFMARGYFLNDRFEYRAGFFQGLREAGGENEFRSVARIQYNFFDTELYNLPSYPGSYFGTRKILAIGASIDDQMTFTGLTADVFADFPTSFGSALGTATYQNWDGGSKFAALAESDIISVDGGLYFKGSKLGPWARVEQRDFAGAGSGDERRMMVGLNYYPFGNNFNVKLGVGRLDRETGRDTNQIILQLQAYYY